MTDIKELSEQDLKQKIENIKAVRERTVNALKRYEEELERRKQEVPLGVPCCWDGKSEVWTINYEETKPIVPSFWKFKSDSNFCGFSSRKSAEKHLEMLLEWRKALVANAKGEPIDIKVLLPLLPKGWVACDSSGEWFVFSCKPFIRQKIGSKDEGIWDSAHHAGFMGHLPFNLKPAKDWRNSLMECGI